MMNTRIRRTTGLLAAAAVLPLALTACSGDSSDSGTSDSAGKASAPATRSSDDMGGSSGSASSSAGTMDQPFGAACSAVPKNGAGSFDGMAKDPVATAASNNPVLSTLVTAVKKAGLVDTLNNAQDITVFAPTNDAFKKIPKATLDKVLGDKAMLTKILTYHVVAGNYDTNKLRAMIVEGNGTATLNTVSGGKLWLMMNGSSNITVKDEKGDVADITISDVRQSNGVIQVVDHVLLPSA